MAQPDSGIGNVTTNSGFIETAMAYSRSRILCAAAHLGVADAFYGHLRALVSIGVTEETDPRHGGIIDVGIIEAKLAEGWRTGGSPDSTPTAEPFRFAQ